MTPAMNAAGNRKMDWFFNEWVYGTLLPEYKFDYTVTPEPDGKWLLHANLTQSEVDANFVMSLTAMKVKLPAKPRKVWINAFHDVAEG